MRNAGLVLATILACAVVPRLEAAAPPTSPVWSLENLHAWSVAPFDSVDRTPEERAQILRRLGIRKYAYSWRERHIASFDAEIEAMQRNGIEIIAWNFLSVEPEDPPARAALEAFRRHGIHPQIWVMQSPRGRPRQALDSFTRTPLEQRERVRQEAERIKRIVAAVSPYGCSVALYAHNSWFGVPDNQLAIIARLQEIGVSGVGMVYNFHHARDEHHDDTLEFPALWRRIMPHVVAITVSGVRFEGQVVFPSEGDAEQDMMRVIQDSGWRGSVGLTAELRDDAEKTLRHYIRGVQWIAQELAERGSGGPRPFPVLPPRSNEK